MSLSSPAAEKDIQRQIVTALRKCGCVVVQTSNYRPTRNTPGAPDLYVWHRRQWYALEVKRPGGRVSPTQEYLISIGAVTIVRSVDDALRVVGIRG